MQKELKNVFSWSVSRDSVFRECPRKYYFRHYGHWSGWESDADPRTREIYVLGKLATRHTWIGQVVHECIAHSLKNIANGIPVLSTTEILDITRNRMRQEFRQSRDGLYWRNPKTFFGLFEHEYRIEVSETEWLETAEIVDHCLRNFYGSPQYAALRSLDPSALLEIERLSGCPFEDVEMRIKLDCATREDLNIVIWDWKTGRHEGRSGVTLQMASYAFYAQQRFGVPLQHVVTRRMDLFRGQLYEDIISPAHLEEILAYIRGSIKDMRALLDDATNNIAREERFRKVERPEICRRCSYLKVCKPDI